MKEKRCIKKEDVISNNELVDTVCWLDVNNPKHHDEYDCKRCEHNPNLLTPKEAFDSLRKIEVIDQEGKFYNPIELHKSSELLIISRVLTGIDNLIEELEERIIDWKKQRDENEDIESEIYSNLIKEDRTLQLRLKFLLKEKL